MGAYSNDSEGRFAMFTKALASAGHIYLKILLFKGSLALMVILAYAIVTLKRNEKTIIGLFHYLPNEVLDSLVVSRKSHA